MFSKCLLSYTATSISFANSYTQRSYGINALYWNPANINQKPMESEYILFPITFGVQNNTFNLHLFNRTFGNYASENDKFSDLNYKTIKAIKLSMGRRFAFGANFNMINFGYSFQNWAYATSTNFVLNGRLDRHLVTLLLQGNNNKVYKFSKLNNNLTAVAYQDATIGYGGYLLNPLIQRYYSEELPEIFGGISFSALRGFGAAELTDFHAIFYADDNNDGVKFEQTSDIRQGTNGNGFKVAIGLSSQVYIIDDVRNVSAGFSVDNIWGKINWTKELMKYSISTYSYEPININNIGNDDLYKEPEIDSLIINKFSTTLPTIFRLGGKYTHSPRTNFSLDIKKSFIVSDQLNYDPEISLGFEHNLFGWMPFQLGYRIPWGESQALYAFGLGLRFKHYETGFGYQSVHGPFNTYTKGLAISTYMKWKF